MAFVPTDTEEDLYKDEERDGTLGRQHEGVVAEAQVVRDVCAILGGGKAAQSAAVPSARAVFEALFYVLEGMSRDTALLRTMLDEALSHPISQSPLTPASTTSLLSSVRAVDTDNTGATACALITAQYIYALSAARRTAREDVKDAIYTLRLGRGPFALIMDAQDAETVSDALSIQGFIREYIHHVSADSAEHDARAEDSYMGLSVVDAVQSGSITHVADADLCLRCLGASHAAFTVAPDTSEDISMYADIIKSRRPDSSMIASMASLISTQKASGSIYEALTVTVPLAFLPPFDGDTVACAIICRAVTDPHAQTPLSTFAVSSAPMFRRSSREHKELAQKGAPAVIRTLTDILLQKIEFSSRAVSLSVGSAQEEEDSEGGDWRDLARVLYSRILMAPLIYAHRSEEEPNVPFSEHERMSREAYEEEEWVAEEIEADTSLSGEEKAARMRAFDAMFPQFVQSLIRRGGRLICSVGTTDAWAVRVSPQAAVEAEGALEQARQRVGAEDRRLLLNALSSGFDAEPSDALLHAVLDFCAGCMVFGDTLGTAAQGVDQDVQAMLLASDTAEGVAGLARSLLLFTEVGDAFNELLPFLGRWGLPDSEVTARVLQEARRSAARESALREMKSAFESPMASPVASPATPQEAAVEEIESTEKEHAAEGFQDISGVRADGKANADFISSDTDSDGEQMTPAPATQLSRQEVEQSGDAAVLEAVARAEEQRAEHAPVFFSELRDMRETPPPVRVNAIQAEEPTSPVFSKQVDRETALTTRSQVTPPRRKVPAFSGSYSSATPRSTWGTPTVRQPQRRSPSVAPQERERERERSPAGISQAEHAQEMTAEEMEALFYDSNFDGSDAE